MGTERMPCCGALTKTYTDAGDRQHLPDCPTNQGAQPVELTITVDTVKLADAVNEIVGEDVESASSIEAWLKDNASSLPTMLLDAVAEQVSEAYV